MGRNLSPVIRRELANLEKDPDSRKSAMKTLKSYVRDLDSKAIPLFLAQVSETKGSGSPSGEYTISLYEVLARVHGRNIVPQIDNIMSTIVKTLMTSAGSFPLHQACSKVVPAIARYGIDPSTPDSEKAEIIYSLCKPLSDILMGSPESVTSGAALCLKALIDSDNWRFVSDDVVNDVCLRVAGALEEKLTQTNHHMGLVMALAKHNSLTVEAYARSLVRSGLHILNADNVEGISQKRFTVIQMINILMKCVDLRSIFSELTKVTDMMEKCYSDENQMPFVRAAALETLQTAKMIAGEKGSKYEKSSSSITGSNFSRRDHSKRNSRDVNICVGRCGSPRFGSPESQTINSFNGYDSFAESPLSTGQASCNFRYGRLVNRKLLRKENGGVDVSLKDGLYSEICPVGDCSETYFEHFGDSELSGSERDGLEGFSGFVHASPTDDTVTRSATPSPQKTQSQYNMDDIRIFTTPRKLIRSLQDSDEYDTGLTEKQVRKIRSPTSCEVGWSPRRQLDENVQCQYPNHDVEIEYKRSLQRVGEVHYENNYAELEPIGHESVSLMGEGPALAPCKASDEVSHDVKTEIDSVSLKRRTFKKAAISLVFGLSLILPAVVFLWVDDQEKHFNLVPT
eukprot:TRINITY_DN39566_c0_g1_i1.p1 TRINITY_DN39566_c0_g1~~TRINITY_DN39566_c0_g1_i1.p1  ORF type:complete len:626 (-),score=124.12 TRINITY_DN39566_c0_g1_i1:168-2045(-)